MRHCARALSAEFCTNTHPDGSADHAPLRLAGVRQGVAHEVHGATPPGGHQKLRRSCLDTFLAVADDELDAPEATPVQAPHVHCPERLGPAGSDVGNPRRACTVHGSLSLPVIGPATDSSTAETIRKAYVSLRAPVPRPRMINTPRLQPLFLSWRSLWSQREATAEKLRLIDELRGYRSRGNHALPNTPPQAELVRTGAVAPALQNALSQSATVSHEQVISWKDQLATILAAERWGRWLHLEHALEIASRSGDLLFCALLLRSMCEEVLRLLVLEYPNACPHLRFVNGADARRAWLSGALLAIAPCADSIAGSVSPSEPPYFDEALGSAGESHLKMRARALNDYVHPNFGSHILALFPEESAASDVLLDAAISIHEAFFSMPWSTDERRVNGHFMPDPHIPTLPKIAWRIENRVLPNIQKAARHPIQDRPWHLPSLGKWLKRVDLDASPSIQALIAEDFLENLAELIPPGAARGPGNITSIVLSSANQDQLPLRWRGAYFLMSLSNARRAETFLQESRCSDAGTPPAIGSASWLHATAHALNLAIASSLLKIDLLIAQAALQAANGNQLGSVFCGRSLIEHVAVISWLGDRLESSWDEIARRSQQGDLSVDHLRSMDEQLARVLTGTKGSIEDDRHWGPEWAERKAARSLNVLSVVEASLSKVPQIRRVYDISSAMIHGRLMRGVEILYASGNLPYQLHNILRGLLAAEYACSDEVQMTARSRCLLLCGRLMHLGNAVADPKRARKLVQRATLAITKLRAGHDFTGTGTRIDPIRFRDGMPYHESFYRYCKEFGLDPAKRRVDWSDGLIQDIVEHQGCLVHFANPPMA